MRKGTIVLVPFPFTDLSGNKVRPAVVLSAPANGQDIIVAFISSIIPKKSSAYTIPLMPSSMNGLKTKSHMRLDKLATLQKNIVVGELGSIDAIMGKKVDVSLRKLFSLS